tara:strand:- start:10853 stop:12397 length:1545 start_codon:yes stop_codon:yes gene_type:complete
MFKNISSCFIVSILFVYPLFAQTSITVNTEELSGVIDRHIFGQFSEHLGRGIYPGIWVGEDSDIPNIEGYRTDVLEALEALQIPNIRWPGGCFADDYRWKDGIGPRNERPVTLNALWGQVPEDNSFGTHEFLRFTELINAEPYISANVGSSNPKDMSDWIEYLTYDGETTLTKMRKENGKEEPWKIKFWGIGNESWGCGGNMTADFYADKYKQFATYAHNLSGNELYKIASGKYDVEYDWTDTLMSKASGLMDAISLHFYTIPTGNWDTKGPSTGFNEEEYIATIKYSLRMDEFIKGHSEIMDKYDPEKRVVLAVDEWGIWTDPLEGTNSGFLEQQNSLRDAFIASTTFDIFAKHNDRVKIANIAQTVNVLQAMVLTEDDKMIKTPTYYAFKFYTVHYDAKYFPLEFESPEYINVETSIPAIHGTASESKDGRINITLTNVDAQKGHDLILNFKELGGKSISSARILTADNVNSYNTFDDGDVVAPSGFNGASLSGNSLNITLPAKSIVVLTLH